MNYLLNCDGTAHILNLTHKKKNRDKLKIDDEVSRPLTSPICYIEKLPRKRKCRWEDRLWQQFDRRLRKRTLKHLHEFIFLPLTSLSIPQLSLPTFPLSAVTGESIHLHLLVSPARRSGLRRLVKWWGGGLKRPIR